MKVIPANIQQTKAPEAQCEWLEARQLPEWDAFVGRHPLGLIYHLSGWKNVLESTFPHIKGHFLVIRDPDSGQIEAGLPVYTVKSWLLGKRLISIPLATAADPLISSASQWDILNSQLQRFRATERCRQFELKLHRSANLLNGSGWDISRQFRYHCTPLDRDSEMLRKSFSKTVARMITKAVKTGITVADSRNVDDLQHFASLYAQTRRRLCLPTLPRRFFHALRDQFGADGLALFIARHNERPVGALICLKHRSGVSAECLGEDQAVRNLGVNQLLYWAAIQQACAEGYQSFNWGRTAVDNIGLLEYKRRWATQEEDLPVYFYPQKNQNESRSATSKTPPGMNVFKSVLKHSPAFLYRKLSDFCYRHWG